MNPDFLSFNHRYLGAPSIDQAVLGVGDMTVNGTDTLRGLPCPEGVSTSEMSPPRTPYAGHRISPGKQ